MADSEGAGASGIVLVALAAGQFLVTLDSSVMNVSIATVAKDGYRRDRDSDRDHAVDAGDGSLMITGEFGQIVGCKRAFAIG